MALGRVTVRRSVATDIAKMYGPELTRRAAIHSVSAVRAKANEAATHSSVADRIEVSVRKVGWHHQIVMSVMGCDGTQVAPHLEFGYFNRWLEHKYGPRDPRARIPGKHIMFDSLSRVRL